MLFSDLKLAPAILRALETEGYTTPTPIQGEAIPVLLEGRDLMGCAQTGTGKTAAFCLPLLHHLAATAGKQHGKAPKALVLAPTRELAQQIADSLSAYGRHTGLYHTVVYGGVNQRPQVAKLRQGVDILVATPGRLLDLHQQGVVNLGEVRHLVLDEADRMLDMGFLPDIRRILKLMPTQRQTLLFSATISKEIKALAETLLQNPVEITVAPQVQTTKLIQQSLYFVDKEQKRDLLKHLLETEGIARALVFVKTKYGADRVAKALTANGVPAQAIHGDKSQGARQQALNQFKAHRTRVLVATDVAARGIDVDDLTHVFNFDLPMEPETYVHRIGRTGRAGASGVAISFCDADERNLLRAVQKQIDQEVPLVTDHPYALNLSPVTLVQTFESSKGKNGFSRKPKSSSYGRKPYGPKPGGNGSYGGPRKRYARSDA
ncbi:MAG: DEAD/DEAH box helicase [Bacteroidia bacterium]|nr:DEAD/DEAH box helicase [Bacteroidia bacterium]